MSAMAAAVKAYGEARQGIAKAEVAVEMSSAALRRAEKALDALHAESRRAAGELLDLAGLSTLVARREASL